MLSVTNVSDDTQMQTGFFQLVIRDFHRYAGTVFMKVDSLKGLPVMFGNFSD